MDVKRLSIGCLLSSILMLFPKLGLAEKLPVFVSILPQQYFVQQIGKDLVDVHVMVEPGAAPHNYEPKPRQMAALSKTRLYFAIGVTFESAWMDKIADANPHLKIIHTDDGIRKIPMAYHHHYDHEEAGHRRAEGHHDDADAHKEEDVHHGEHGVLDPHIWLSPPLVKIQAGHILNALKAEDPDNTETYQRNYDAFIRELNSLHREIENIFVDMKGDAFMVYHPSWGYFADTYGLRQIPVELEGKAPKPAQLRELITHAREEGVRVIFVQPQFSRKSAETVAKAIGGEVVFADPLAANWADNLRQQAGRFKAALQRTP